MNPIFQVLALLVVFSFTASGQLSTPYNNAPSKRPQIAGFVAIKEQPFHADASANVVGYVTFSDDLWLTVKINTGAKEFAIDRKKIAGMIEVVSSIPLNIMNDSEVQPLRDSLKKYQDFSSRFPKSKALLTSHITALDRYTKEYESGKYRVDGEWFEAAALNRLIENQRRSEDARNKLEKIRKEKEEHEARQRQEDRDALIESQRRKGLGEYQGNWLPLSEALRLNARDEDERIKAEQAEKSARETKMRAAEEAHHREVAAAEQARADALKVAEAEKKLAASAVMLRGNVEQITSEGMLVSSHYGSVNIPNAIKDPKNRPDLQAGDFFLTGHPRQDNKVTDSWFDVDAVYDGIFEYTTVLGATRRVHRFRVLKAYY